MLRQRVLTAVVLVAVFLGVMLGLPPIATIWLVTVLNPARDMMLWNGESQNFLSAAGNAMSVRACREHPFSGDTHLRVQEQFPFSLPPSLVRDDFDHHVRRLAISPDKV